MGTYGDQQVSLKTEQHDPITEGRARGLVYSVRVEISEDIGQPNK